MIKEIVLVILDRLKYVSKMEELLSDCIKFVKIEFNPLMPGGNKKVTHT